jgi:hypothetical protein
MIKLPDGTWCYSQKLPESYSYEGHGPGSWVGEDIPRWNVMYLAEPELFERYGKREIKLSQLYEIGRAHV